MSNTETILEFLETVPNGCCDDCVSEHTGVEPRQSVNQICRRLEKDGRIARKEGRCTLGDHIKKLNILAATSPGTPVAPSKNPSARQPSAPRRIAIEELRNQLDRFCKALWDRYERTKTTLDLAALVSRLSDRGIIPEHQANMMHTIRGLRNVYVHEHLEMGSRETLIAQTAWDIISEWAESSEPELWRLTKR